MPFDPVKLQKQLDAQVKKASSGAGVDVSKQLERQYGSGLIKQYVTPVTKDIEKTVYPFLEKEEPFYIKNYDPSDLQALINGLRQQWRILDSEAEKIARQMADRTNEFNREKFVKNINKAIGVDVTDILADSNIEGALNSSVQANVSLIKDMPQTQIDRIQSIVMQGVDGGHDFFSIKKQLRKVDGISKRRARLIARDQVSKLNGALNQIRQDDLGITHYIWRTSEDERVRETHQENNGKRFAWDSPPAETGHPGEDIQCRCTADPDLRGMRIIRP